MRTDTGTKLECRVCWYIYDPALGDPVWQVGPGVAFTDLPPHWTCPNCAAEKSGFIALDDD